MGIKEIYHSKFRWLGVALMILPLLSSCIREEEFNNSPQGNFEALWKIIDEQYCFLDYKTNRLGMPSTINTHLSHYVQHG